MSDTFWPLSLSSNFVSEITTLAETLQFCLQQMKRFNWSMVGYKTWIPAEPEFMERTRFEWFCHTSLSGVNQNRAPWHKGKIKGQSRINGLDLKCNTVRCDDHRLAIFIKVHLETAQVKNHLKISSFLNIGKLNSRIKTKEKSKTTSITFRN